MSEPIKGRDGLVSTAFLGGVLVSFGAVTISGLVDFPSVWVGWLICIIGTAFACVASLIGEGHQ